MGSCFCLPNIRSGPEYNLFRHIENNEGVAITELTKFNVDGFIAIDQILHWVRLGLLRLDTQQRKYVLAD